MLNISFFFISINIYFINTCKFLGLLKSAKKHDCVKSVVQRLECDATRMKKQTLEVSHLRHE